MKNEVRRSKISGNLSLASLRQAYNAHDFNNFRVVILKDYNFLVGFFLYL